MYLRFYLILVTCNFDKINANLVILLFTGLSALDMDLWSRNSSVVASHAAVSCDQPIAASVGIDILKLGGNAADAAVATMAALSVIQPMTCGIGGDCQCLFYRKSDQKVFAVNGSGRTGENATLEKVLSAGIVNTTDRQFCSHGLWVSVPGAVAGMCSVVENFGSRKLTMKELLGPAVKLAEDGVPVPPKTSDIWNRFKKILLNSKQYVDVLPGDGDMLPGEKICNKKLAQSLKMIGLEGSKAFYEGKIAEKLIKEVQVAGGVITMNDMKEHLLPNSLNEVSDAAFVDFYGFRIWEMKPNTIGIVALVAFNALKYFDLKSFVHNSPEYIHLVAEVIKHAYTESWNYLCDPQYSTSCLESLLSKESGKRVKMKIDSSDRACSGENIVAGSDTAYVAVVDSEGSGCSFICSVSSNFGTGIIPEDCGFVLHDRLKSMSLDARSPNCYGPKKVPLHSIIPSMVTDPHTNELLAVLGVCGRWMQPQGHIQLLLNMIIFGMDPQTALHQPRFYVGNCRNLTDYVDTLSLLKLEHGIPLSVVPYLQQKGHDVNHSVQGYQVDVFGKGNIIARPVLWNQSATDTQNCWWAGADPRTDGCAIGF